MDKREKTFSFKSFFSKYMVYIAFVALLIVFSLTLSNVGNGFLDMGNVWNIVRQTALITILATGMTFALSAGQIDLSVGTTVGLVSLATAVLVQSHGVVVGVIAGVALGALIGAVNGVLIAWVSIPPFIATLGMQILIGGVSRTVSELKSFPVTDTFFNNVFGGGTIGSVPVLLIWMLVIVALGHIFLKKRPFGRKVLAVGGNPKSAEYSGINVKMTIFKVMLICGLLAGIAGVLWTGRFSGGRYSLGEDAETSAIAAAVLGGTSIFGGKGSVIGACIGSVMMGMIDNALVMYGLDVYQQMIVRGVIILLAVAITVNAEKSEK